MSPEERQLLQGLFDRMKDNSGAQRDAEAERMIADNVRQQPYAPYLMAQAVLVQDQALQAANARLQELEAQVQQSQGQSGGGGFLSSIFGSSTPQRPPPVPAQRPVWNQGGTQGGYPPPQQGYAPQQQGGPWGGGAPMGGGMMGGGGGGFLSGALQTAAGVAGGVMLADGIRGLFGGHNNPMGIASGMPGVGSETVVNNYYGDSGASSSDYRQDAAQDADFATSDGSGATNADWQQDADQNQDMAQDAADFGSDDGGSWDT